VRKTKTRPGATAPRLAGASQFDGRPIPQKPEEMATLRCPACGRSLYMSLRILRSPSWLCPACGVKNRPSSDEIATGDAALTHR
jgi:hypothetical protein